MGGSPEGEALHTSKRMHFIEDNRANHATNFMACLHTSKRMHFIEEHVSREGTRRNGQLAYVKTYALH